MSLTFALAQLNPTLGDIAGNLAKARAAHHEATQNGADIIAFTELFLTGYPPEDLVLKPAFQHGARIALEELAKDTKGKAGILIGLPYREGDSLYNAYAYLDEGEIKALRFKVDLPNYGVFDEKRVFDAGTPQGPVNIRGLKVGLPVCEDIWGEEIVETLAESGAQILLTPNGSPYWRGKTDERLNIVLQRVVESGLACIYLNQIGGQDELVFDGGSFSINPDNTLCLQMPAFEEAISYVQLSPSGIAGGTFTTLIEGDEADYAACVLGLRDYVNKNGFKGVLLGLSGGIDSALCAAMACDALGASRVHGIMMPYKYTSDESLKDAKECAQALGIRYDIMPISSPVEGFESALKPLFAGFSRDITEENLQSRTRGTLLMAMSNKFGAMVVTTGNKSEMSVGYATIYGDMNGGFNPIKDLYKMQVFRLCHLRNSWKPEGALGANGIVIPENIIAKPPSAELRENQKDEDSLPPYAVLDAILEGLVENEESVHALIAKGFEAQTVKRIEHLLAIAEYKRRQAAPGVKVTKRGFGRDRRYPITNKFRDSGEKIMDFLPSKASSSTQQASDDGI
jgi:NAD+ synthase